MNYIMGGTFIIDLLATIPIAGIILTSAPSLFASSDGRYGMSATIGGPYSYPSTTSAPQANTSVFTSAPAPPAAPMINIGVEFISNTALYVSLLGLLKLVGNDADPKV